MPDLEPPIEKLGYGLEMLVKSTKFMPTLAPVIFLLLIFSATVGIESFRFCYYVLYPSMVYIANLHHVAMYSYDSCSHVQYGNSNNVYNI